MYFDFLIYIQVCLITTVNSNTLQLSETLSCFSYSAARIDSATAAAVLNTKTADYKRKLEKEFNQKQAGLLFELKFYFS